MGELDQWGSPAFVRSGTAQAALNAHAASGNGNFTLNPEPMRTLLFAAVLSTTSLCAQTTFAPVGARWTYEQGFWNQSDSNLAVFEVTMDTVINGLSCSWLAPVTGNFFCHQLYQAVFARHDSVFFWDEQVQLFQLLYRFDAGIGDAWVTPVNWLQSGLPCALDTLMWTVQDTGHVIVDGVPLRRLDVTVNSALGCMPSSSDGVIIERLGDLGYLFDWAHWTCFAESFEGLRCYSDPDITWLNPQFPQCDLSTGVSERNSPRGIIASPSILEVGGSVHVTLPVGSTGSLIDATGHTISALPANGDLTIAHSGLYFLRATSEQGQPSIARVLVR